jgi:hypothetical protein
LKGARNRSQLGNAYPIILGKHLYTPMYIGTPYTTVESDGTTQYYHALFLLGYSRLSVKDIKLNELEFATNSTDVLDGYITVDGSNFSSNDARLELRQGASECELYPQKVIEEQLNIQLLNADGTPLVVPRFSAQNPQKIQIELGVSALYALDDSGIKSQATVRIRAEISYDRGATWHPFGQFNGSQSYDASTGESTFSTIITKQKRLVAEKTVEYSDIIDTDRVAELRIQRITPQPTSGNVTDTFYLTGIRTWCFNYKESLEEEELVPQVPMVEADRDITARLALRIKASSTLSGTIDALNCMLTSHARTWNGSAWSSVESPTQNPASLLLKSYQLPCLRTKAYPDTRIDLEKLGELYEYCEENNYKCNGVVSRQLKLSDLQNKIMNTCKCFRLLNGDKYSVFIDKPNPYPVAILNNHNILSVPSNSKEFSDPIDGYKISFVNENNGYQKDEIYCMYVNGDEQLPDKVTESITLEFVTNPAQVWKLGKYTLAKKKYRTETWIREVGLDGARIDIGDLVTLQDDTILVGIGDGAEIKELIMDGSSIAGIKTDGAFSVTDLTKSYGVKMQCSNGVDMPAIRTEAVTFSEEGLFNELYFATPIASSEAVRPSVGDIISFGITDRISIDAICIAKKDNGDFKYELTLVPYTENVYTAETGVMPEFDSKVTSPIPLYVPSDVPQEYVTREELIDSVSDMQNGTNASDPNNVSNLTAVADEHVIHVAWSPLGQGLRNTVQKYTIQVSFDSGVTWEDAGTSKTNSFDYAIDRTRFGYPEAEAFSTWRMRVQIMSIYNKTSEQWTSTTVDTDSYGTWLLPVPTVTEKSENRTVILTMDLTPSSGRKLYGNVRYKIRIRRGVIGRWEHIAYWMHDTANDLYYTLSSNQGHCDQNVAYTSGTASLWTQTTAEVYNEKLKSEYKPLTDTTETHVYSYSKEVEENISGDTEWQKPATTENPFGSHDNYKSAVQPLAESERYVTSDSVYIQTLPLYYTDETVNNYIDTPYYFDVCAYNEAGNSAWLSGADTLAQKTSDGRLGTANCTNLRDVVLANETAKASYVESLSAISANLGEIRQGTLGGSDNNYWTLSDKTSRLSDADYEGAFRVGGAHEYLKVTPIIDQITHRGTGEFKIEFNVGNFNVTSDNTNLNGEIIAYPEPQYDNEGNLLPPKERARINHNGIYFEVRDDGNSPWRDVVHQSKTGTVTPSLQTNPNTANGSLVITNASMDDRRKNGSDIGLPLPASDAEVWHFDTDFYNQHGQNTLTIEDEAGGVEHTLVGEGDTPTGAITDFTPALLAIAPYATVAKSIYGNFSLSKTFSASNSWQVEFWMKHIYNENQTIFSIGNSQQSITLRVRNAEPYYNVPDTENEEPPYDNGIIEHDIAYNMPVAKDLYLEYVSPSGTEAYHYLTLEENQWYHVGVFCDDDSGIITVYLSKVATRTAYTFAQSARFVDDITVEINPSKKLMCVDELMVSPTVAGSQSDFNQNTTNRIPFGALDRSKKHFVLDVDDSNVWTNLFDNTTVRNQIKEIVREVLQEEGLIARR